MGTRYFSAFKKALENKDIANTRFLEIGCANGYICHLLKQNGAKKVSGVEPGKEAIVGRKKYNINIIRDFFPIGRYP